MVVPQALEFMYKNSLHTNLTSVPRQQHVTESEFETRDAAKLFDLVLFRLSPHFLKRYIYNDQLWLFQSLLHDKEYLGLQFFADKAFLHNLSENLTTDRSEPVYKYLHLMLSHDPMVTNLQCRYAERVLPTERETNIIQARCGLMEVLKLFERMKKAGIYNEALIILMADHGSWVRPEGLKYLPSNDDGLVTMMNPDVVSLAQPLLVIKRPGEKGSLRISDAPSWIIDTADTIADGMGLDARFEGRSVFQLKQNEARERKFFAYDYNRKEWTNDYLSSIQEFNINGKINDSASWSDVAAHLPGDVVRPTQGMQGKSSWWFTTTKQSLSE